MRVLISITGVPAPVEYGGFSRPLLCRRAESTKRPEPARFHGFGPLTRFFGRSAGELRFRLARLRRARSTLIRPGLNATARH